MKYAAREYTERGHLSRGLNYRGAPNVRPIRDGVVSMGP